MRYEPRIALRRGNTEQNNDYIGLKGELTANTDVYGEVRLHDGVTPGGEKMNILDTKFIVPFFEWTFGRSWQNKDYKNKNK